MNEVTNPTSVETPTVEVTSEEKQRINLFIKASEKFPVGLAIERNGVNEVVSKQPFKRGSLKEYGCVYLGPGEDFYKSLETKLTYLGEEKANAILNAACVQVFTTATEAAITDLGDFNTDMYVKAVQEFSARGEPSKELKERLAAAQEEFNRLTSDPAFMNRMLTGGLNKDEQGALKELRDELAYCSTTLKSRERKPKE